MKAFQVFDNLLPIRQLPEELQGLRIVLIGDLHEQVFGVKNQDLADTVKNLHPDLILCTGDMLDRNTRTAQPFLDFLDSLGKEFPIYFSMGNHELDVERSDPAIFTQFVEQLVEKGVKILRNEYEIIYFHDQGIALYGLDTKGSGVRPSLSVVQRRLGEYPYDLPSIVLAHDPEWFPVLAQWGASAVLSGHIHGGLIALPGLGGVLAPGMRIFPRYDAGLFLQDGASLYVTRGFGDSFEIPPGCSAGACTVDFR